MNTLSNQIHTQNTYLHHIYLDLTSMAQINVRMYKGKMITFVFYD